MKIAVVGASGLVGTEILKVLQERNFPVTDLVPVASERSAGKMISFKDKDHRLNTVQSAVDAKPSIAIFSAGSAVSQEWAPVFAANGTVVIDNSSCWRMDPTKKLVVPEVNGHVLTGQDMIIANPNCSTIQMVLVLNPLHKRYRIRRVVVSTYQSVTGTGVKAVEQLMNERKGIQGPMAYAHRIDLNAIPQIDIFMDNGYTKEEMKMVKETCKIMMDDAIKVTATCVRIPTMGGHCESVNIEFEDEFELGEVRKILAGAAGIKVEDDPVKLEYPMPLNAQGKDDTFVGRLRRDETQPKTLNCWIVSDNLRKGAATNAVQIAEYLVKEKIVS